MPVLTSMVSLKRLVYSQQKEEDMATIYLKVDVDRTEGKTESTESVAEALVAEVENTGLDVEDSQYEVTSVEAVAQPTKGGGGAVAVEGFLTDIIEAFLGAYPVSLDAPSRFDAEKAVPLLQACIRAAGHPAVGEAMTRTKVRRAKEKPKARVG